MLCSGKCGREGAGSADSGQPELDSQFSWCDECWPDLVSKRMPPGLVKHLPAGTLVPFRPEPLSVPDLNSMTRTERKILAADSKTVATITAVSPSATGSGSFSGYLAAYGKDHGGDSIQPGAMDASAAALNSGAIAWHLTDAHSDLASDVVATVTAAAVDSRGLRIEGQWMPGERAQALRQMVRNGARLGLSIDYLADASRPDGTGGRLLDLITVVGGAVTPKPMNAAATIIQGKHGASVPVVDLYADAQARHADPDRDRIRREDARLAAADWPPRSWDRATRLALLDGLDATRAKALAAAADPAGERGRARREADNRYSSDLAAWMAANR